MAVASGTMELEFSGAAREVTGTSDAIELSHATID